MTPLPSNISFLSKYTRSERLIYLIDATGEHPAELRKRYIKAFLSNLRNTFHYAYILLDNLPLEDFSIVRYYDRRTAVNRWSYKEQPDIYSLRDFLRNAAQFHDKDEFRITFCNDHFYFEPELTRESFMSFYEKFLHSYCERGLRLNRPVLLSADLCKKHKLTARDKASVAAYLEEYNRIAAAKIQAEYDALSCLDCVKKQVR